MGNMREPDSGDKASEPVKTSPALVEQARQMAYTLYKQGLFEQAEILLAGVLAARKGDAWALSLLGAIRRHQHQMPEARRLLEQAHALDPGDRNIESMLAEVVGHLRGMN